MYFYWSVVFVAQVQYKKRGGGRGGGSVKTGKDRTPKEVLDTLAAARSECMVSAAISFASVGSVFE